MPQNTQPGPTRCSKLDVQLRDERKLIEFGPCGYLMQASGQHLLLQVMEPGDTGTVSIFNMNDVKFFKAVPSALATIS